MQFKQLNEQDKFFARGLVWKKVSSTLAADVRVSGDGRVESFAGSEDCGEVLSDEQAEAKLQELAEEKRRKAEQPAPLMAGYEPEEPQDAAESSDVLEPADIRKLKRDELDALAEKHAINIEGLNVEDSREYLIQELCPEETEAK